MLQLCSITEDLKARKGSKSIIIEGLDWHLERVRGDMYMQSRYGRGTVMKKHSVIDCDKAEIRRPGVVIGVLF